MPDKLMTMQAAIERFVPDGSTVVLGTPLEALIPFAAGHEMIRQRRRDLVLVGPISDMLFDQLIGAGCVRRVEAAWVGNVSAGLGHNYRRAAEQQVPRPLEIYDYSNLTISLALSAGAMGAPYIPTHSLLGTDLLHSNPRFQQSTSPFGGEPIVLVPALQPDVAIIQVQRSSLEGDAHCWGPLGVTEEAALASTGVVVVAEEIVERAVILSDPNRVVVPHFKVVAVVHEPGAAHPSPVQGYYSRDNEFYHEYHRRTRDLEDARAWLDEWVHGLPDRAAYLQKLGPRWPDLAVRQPRLAAPVDYGY